MPDSGGICADEEAWYDSCSTRLGFTVVGQGGRMAVAGRCWSWGGSCRWRHFFGDGGVIADAERGGNLCSADRDFS